MTASATVGYAASAECLCLPSKDDGVADAMIEALVGLDHRVGHPTPF